MNPDGLQGIAAGGCYLDPSEAGPAEGNLTFETPEDVDAAFAQVVERQTREVAKSVEVALRRAKLSGDKEPRIPLEPSWSEEAIKRVMTALERSRWDPRIETAREPQMGYPRELVLYRAANV